MISYRDDYLEEISFFLAFYGNGLVGPLSGWTVMRSVVVWKHVEIGDAAVLISFSESLRWKRWKFVSFRRTYENELEILLAIGVCTESIGIIIYLIDIIDTRFIASYVCEYRNEIHDIQSR